MCILGFDVLIEYRCPLAELKCRVSSGLSSSMEKHKSQWSCKNSYATGVGGGAPDPSTGTVNAGVEYGFPGRREMVGLPEGTVSNSGCSCGEWMKVTSSEASVVSFIIVYESCVFYIMDQELWMNKGGH